MVDIFFSNLITSSLWFKWDNKSQLFYINITIYLIQNIILRHIDLYYWRSYFPCINWRHQRHSDPIWPKDADDSEESACNRHKMVECAALNCTIKSGQGLSMCLFPRDPIFRKRDGFEPSQYSLLCERHFDRDQFSMNPDIANNVRFQK